MSKYLFLLALTVCSTLSWAECNCNKRKNEQLPAPIEQPAPRQRLHQRVNNPPPRLAIEQQQMLAVAYPSFV
ncbi:hypothetical protein EBS02_04785 [bacterium]|nr:hypothetical protein [bacterium]